MRGTRKARNAAPTAGTENDASTRARAAVPSARARAGSSRSAQSAPASACASPTGTTAPHGSGPPVTRSRMPCAVVHVLVAPRDRLGSVAEIVEERVQRDGVTPRADETQARRRGPVAVEDL